MPIFRELTDIESYSFDQIGMQITLENAKAASSR